MLQQRLLSTKEAARYLGVSPAFLERDRWAGARIPYVKIGTRTIRYDIAELDRYLQARRQRSTSEAGGRQRR